MVIIALALLFVAISLGAAGQILLKAGLKELGERPAPLIVLKSIVTNAKVFGGYVCYGLSSLLYVVALSRLDLSYAYPLVALSYVMVTVLAWRFLDETVPLLRWAGLAVIMAGVVVFALSYRDATPEAGAPAGLEQSID
jgi:multidrug transporter EmrE-like cation transporter